MLRGGKDEKDNPIAKKVLEERQGALRVWEAGRGEGETSRRGVSEPSGEGRAGKSGQRSKARGEGAAMGADAADLLDRLQSGEEGHEEADRKAVGEERGGGDRLSRGGEGWEERGESNDRVELSGEWTGAA